MIDDGLAVDAIHPVDFLIFIVGIIVEVGGRNFLEDAARIGPETMPNTGLHQAGFAGPERPPETCTERMAVL